MQRSKLGTELERLPALLSLLRLMQIAMRVR
jgi:hypothetical protein